MEVEDLHLKYLMHPNVHTLCKQQTVSPLEGEKLSTSEKPRNVSRFMLTEPKKDSNCIRGNKP